MSLGNKGSRNLVALGLLAALACGKGEAGPAYSDATAAGAAAIKSTIPRARRMACR